MNDAELRKWETDLRVSLGQSDWREGAVPKDGRGRTTRYSRLHRQWGRPFALTDVDVVWAEGDWFRGEGRYWFLFDQMRAIALVIESQPYEEPSERGDSWMGRWALEDAALPCYVVRWDALTEWTVEPYRLTPRLIAFQSVKRGGDSQRLSDGVVREVAERTGLRYLEDGDPPLEPGHAAEWFVARMGDAS